VLCIATVKNGKTKSTVIDEDSCQACTICATRCPEYAISMIRRDRPFEVGIKVDQVTDEIREICQRAHMYPDQVVCYCHRVQAKEVVAAILAGAKTPEEVSQKTGARTGCGVLCITGIMRAIRAAGLELGAAPGWQWYNMQTTIWNVPAEIAKKHPGYYLDADRKAIDKMFPGGEER
jgi:bacterioferritin-associated ferredoxin/ferredoxin